MAGGRVFVVGIYFGLIVSLVTTFCAINSYFGESAIFDEDSPFFSSEMVSFMKKTVFQTYTTSYLTICLLAFGSLYVCV
jgi:hypothetical protein